MPQTPSDETHIQVDHLTMAYGDFVIQRDLTFDVNRGEVFIIMGGSGCGKSTAAANLAFSLGRQKDLRTIVIDFDMRRMGLAEILRHFSPEDLGRLNRIELAAMGVTEDLREEFLRHPSYSPSEGTQLVDALSSLEGIHDRAAFIQAAVGATSSDEAQRFEQIADLMPRIEEGLGELLPDATVIAQPARLLHRRG